MNKQDVANVAETKARTELLRAQTEMVKAQTENVRASTRTLAVKKAGK